MLLNCSVGEDSWESLGLQGDPISLSQRKSTLNIHWKDWCWSWSSSTLATCCEELAHLKRPWCWERLRAGGEGDDRGWDGWLVSLTWWTWVWVNSRSWWRTGRTGVLCFMGLQRIGHDWVTELNWMSHCYFLCVHLSWAFALFLPLIIKNNAAIKLYTSRCMKICFSLGYRPRSRISGSCSNFMFTILRNFGITF